MQAKSSTCRWCAVGCSQGVQPAASNQQTIKQPVAISCQPRVARLLSGTAVQTGSSRNLRSGCGCRALSDDLSTLRSALRGGQDGHPDEAYRSGAEFLRSLGLDSTAEITRVLDVAMNPNSIYSTYRDKKRSYNGSARRLSVEADMKPVVDYLRSQGLAQQSIIKIILDHPPVLSYSVETRLQPFFEYLASIGIEQPSSVVAKRPSLLGLNVEDNLQRMVGYLQANDYSLEQITNFLETTL